MTRKLSKSQIEVVPTRYLDKPFDLDEFPRWGKRVAARQANPYKPGDVVWSQKGRRALVVTVHVERVLPWDTLSDLLPLLLVREETAKGTWGGQWVKMWPGDVDRAYEAWQNTQSVTA